MQTYGKQSLHRGFMPPKKYPATWSLLLISLSVFLFEFLFRSQVFSSWLSFNLETGVSQWQAWRFFSAQFVHLKLLGMCMTALILLFIAPRVEEVLGSRFFLLLYLVAGCSVPLFYSLLTLFQLIPHTQQTLIFGAQGGILALFTASYVFFGDTPTRFLFFQRIFKLKTLILIFAGVWFLSLVFIKDPALAASKASYLIAIPTAWSLIYFKFKNKATSSQNFSFFRKKQASSRAKQIKKAKKKQKKKSPLYRSKIKPRSELQHKDSKVDAILDKISEQGLHSLSEKERNLLLKASKKHDR